MVKRSFLPGQPMSSAIPEVRRGPSRFLQVTFDRSRGSQRPTSGAVLVACGSVPESLGLLWCVSSRSCEAASRRQPTPFIRESNGQAQQPSSTWEVSTMYRPRGLLWQGGDRLDRLLPLPVVDQGLCRPRPGIAMTW
jgi:hypothetical protein